MSIVSRFRCTAAVSFPNCEAIPVVFRPQEGYFLRRPSLLDSRNSEPNPFTLDQVFPSPNLSAMTECSASQAERFLLRSSGEKAVTHVPRDVPTSASSWRMSPSSQDSDLGRRAAFRWAVIKLGWSGFPTLAAQAFRTSGMPIVFLPCSRASAVSRSGVYATAKRPVPSVVRGTSRALLQ